MRHSHIIMENISLYCLISLANFRLLSHFCIFVQRIKNKGLLAAKRNPSKNHSHSQRPCSFWTAPRIATTGKVQHRKSAIHRFPVTLGMLRVKSDNLNLVPRAFVTLFQRNGTNLTNLVCETITLRMFRKFDLPRGRDSSC